MTETTTETTPIARKPSAKEYFFGIWRRKGHFPDWRLEEMWQRHQADQAIKAARRAPNNQVTHGRTKSNRPG